MSTSNLDIYMPILILLIFGVVLVSATLLVGKLIRPSNPSPVKNQPYECGEEPVGTAWSVFNMRLIFMEIFLFLLILAAGLAYCWRKGDLDWVKTYHTEKGQE